MDRGISDHDFARMMDRVGPFEDRPFVAVGVSGGADSLALVLLMARWVAGQGGQVVALSVDHGLRPQSGQELADLAQWLGQAGIEHHILPWLGPKPAGDIMAQARQARYGLMQDWCRHRGVLHLALAHHRHDQAETMVLRLGRGSGLTGLSAMRPVGQQGGVRRIRPLLDVDKACLRAFLRAQDQPWIEDPSNADMHYARPRLRDAMPRLADLGLTADRLAQTASRLARADDAHEEALAHRFAQYVGLDMLGFARLEKGAVRGPGDDVGLRLLARVIMAVSGVVHPPRHDRLLRLAQALSQPDSHDGGGGDATLSGCRIHWQGGQGIICREWGRAQAEILLHPGQAGIWDGRFAFRVGPCAPPGMRLGYLGPVGWKTLSSRWCPRWDGDVLPVPVRRVLPVIRVQESLFVLSNLGYKGGLDGARWLDQWSWVPPLCVTRPIDRLA